MTITPSDTILFQGDSITDAGRRRPAGDAPIPANDASFLGIGYAAKTAGMLLSRFPDHALQIHNRGISGDRVTYLKKRWQRDCLDLKPDILSILIGINDTWHGVAKGTPEDGVGLEEFDRVLRELITTTREAFPGLRVVLCEPFTTETGAVLEMNFHPDIDDRRTIVRTIAGEHADVFVPFQDLFDQLCKEAPADHWAYDGVHPSDAGHQRMAEFWMKCVCLGVGG
jgi:lysophospholipase L1-like esterase